MKVITIDEWISLSMKGSKLKFEKKTESGNVFVDIDTGEKYLVNKNGFIK